MIEIKNLCKSFVSPSGSVEALNDINLTIKDGDIFGIIGMSGAGKSTLVRCINMLERPTTGTVVIDGQDLCTLKEKELRKIRQNVTMIFQNFNLMQQKNCLKNVCFPMELEGIKKEDAQKRAMELLALVGLTGKEKSYPSQLSGGQQQRVAIARALATDPKVLLCDEATSALDPNTTNSILELLRSINEKLEITIIIITHQMNVVETVCKNVAILENGKVVETGEVGEIFTNPKSDAAKRLVFPDTSPDESILNIKNAKYIRIVFNGSDSASTPLIAKMASETGIHANIAYASTKSINGMAYGSMLLSVIDNENDVENAIKYLSKASGVSVQEVQTNVQ